MSVLISPPDFKTSISNSHSQASYLVMLCTMARRIVYDISPLSSRTLRAVSRITSLRIRASVPLHSLQLSEHIISVLLSFLLFRTSLTNRCFFSSGFNFLFRSRFWWFCAFLIKVHFFSTCLRTSRCNS